jgi:hypothetical protein
MPMSCEFKGIVSCLRRSVMLPKTPSEHLDIFLDCTKRILELHKQPEPAEPA